MKSSKKVTYSNTEEFLNIATHGAGFVLAIFALMAMLMKVVPTGNTKGVIGAIVFGISMLVLYGASTLYHGSKTEATRNKLRVFDHASIYVLIAGTYTPFTLLSLPETIGWIMFSITWSMAISGIILKLFFTGKYDLLSTIMYIVMGWSIVFAFDPLIDAISLNGFLWLLGGGVAYTIGAILYQAKSLPYNHAIFHAFVLLGSAMHFVAIYCYVLAM